MIKVNKKHNVVLDEIFYICYPIRFKKKEVQALINFGNKVNAMMPAYAPNLGLKVRWTDIRAQKINGSIFKMFEIVLANFQVENKFGKAWFFQETFLLAYINIKVVLRMSFFTFSNGDIQFAEKKLT